GENVADVLDDGTRLRADVELRGAHGVDLHAHEAVVGAARTGAGHKQEVPGAANMGELAPGGGLARHESGFGRLIQGDSPIHLNGEPKAGGRLRPVYGVKRPAGIARWPR